MMIFGRDVTLLDRVFGNGKRSVENPSVPLSSPRAAAILFGDWHSSAAGVAVTVETALGVPTVWAAVNFLARTLAALPLQLFRRTADGQELDTQHPLYGMLHDAVNDEWSSFRWRQYTMNNVLLGGRGFTFIERNAANRVMNLWPLDPTKMSVEKVNNRTQYNYHDKMRSNVYQPNEIIDLPFFLAVDGITHHSPINRLRNAIGLAIALETYASKFFQNGGVPPLQLVGPFQSPSGAKRASDDIIASLKDAREGQKNILSLPIGHELKQIGFDPEKGQMTDARRMQVEEIARVYGLPPQFLQDLSRATFANAEQQDLHLVKHVITQWVTAWEQELNLKLFTPRNRRNFVKFNVDGLLRGDFKSRMDGYAASVQNAVRTPNEVRALENLPPKAEGDKLLIQGATVPLGSQPISTPMESNDADAAS